MSKILGSVRFGILLPANRMGMCFLILLCAHFLVGLFRFPRTLDKKLAEIADYQELGAYAISIGRHAPESAALVERLALSTAEDCLLYFEGEWKGDLELAAALLYPRLLIRFDPGQPGRDAAFGRNFARLEAPDGVSRYPVIQGRGKSLGLRWQ